MIVHSRWPRNPSKHRWVQRLSKRFSHSSTNFLVWIIQRCFLFCMLISNVVIVVPIIRRVVVVVVVVRIVTAVVHERRVVIVVTLTVVVASSMGLCQNKFIDRFVYQIIVNGILLFRGLVIRLVFVGSSTSSSSLVVSMTTIRSGLLLLITTPSPMHPQKVGETHETQETNDNHGC